jgi:uncharacterized membrane protein
VPVAVLGLVFFGSMGLMNLPRAWSCPSCVVRGTRVGLAALGIAFAMYLVYTELFTLHAICLWCTSAHVMAFFLFAVALFGESLGRPLTTDRQVWVHRAGSPMTLEDSHAAGSPRSDPDGAG